MGALLPAWFLGLVPLAAGAAQEIPRPEHPEPQARREEWRNLNGPWEFFETDDDLDPAEVMQRERFPETITVPFCRESPLSGIGRRGFVDFVWYRRRFEVPAEWAGRRVRLHIGACDWRTTVWVNGAELGTHTGGNAPITFEITPHLDPGGNTVVVRAFDDARSGLQQLGKQSRRLQSHGIFYTRTTGIWQTVWLEAVGRTFVRDLWLCPDLDRAQVAIHAGLDGALEGRVVEVEVRAAGRTVGQGRRDLTTGSVELAVPLVEVRAWGPEDPFLYEAVISVREGDRTVDRVESYFGLRKVEVRGPLFLINGRPVFQRLVLDQGFYPDGVWTAPSDAALRRDIELAQAAGFNGARLHQKVFEPRFHYWADRLGYLTWGEGPSYGPDYGNPGVALPVLDEWREILLRDRSHPSIIGWCAFNESPREAAALQTAVYHLTKALDPTRPVIDTSGYVKSVAEPDVDDRHDYDQDPASLARRYAPMVAGRAFPPEFGLDPWARPFFLSEFGGIGWVPEGEEGWGYGSNPRTLEEFYARLEGLCGALQRNRFHCGFCYTQLTDVEQERNGIFYFDRRSKFDLERVRAILGAPAAYETDPPGERPARVSAWRTLVASARPAGPVGGGRARGPGARGAAAAWRYTTGPPPGDWTQPGFDARGWPEGAAAFGHKEGWERWIRTPWSSADLWLRREFQWDGADFASAWLMLHYDNATRVFLNGHEVLSLTGWNDAYQPFEVTDGLRAHLAPGRNVLAVHVHQDTGGQYFDAALLLEDR